MKSVIKSLIVFLLFAVFSQAAFCYTLTYDELNKIIVDKIKKETKYPDCKISVSGIPYEKIITNETVAPRVEIVSQGPNFKRVTIKDSFNNTIKAFSINVQTLIYQNVLVAASQIPFGAEINSSNTTIERKEISRYLDKVYFSPLNGVSASRNYPKGSMILTNGVKQKPVVLKNSTINITFLSQKGLKITVEGKALNDGAQGDTILVRSNKYNKTYNAVVSSNREVTVRI